MAQGGPWAIRRVGHSNKHATWGHGLMGWARGPIWALGRWAYKPRALGPISSLPFVFEVDDVLPLFLLKGPWAAS